MNENKYLEQQNETMGENSFMKSLLKKRLNQKGLTLIELLAVIVILAIVAAIAIPAIGNLIESQRIKAVKSDAILVLNAAQLERTNEDTEFDGTTGVDATYLDSAGVFDTAAYTIDVNAAGVLTISTDDPVEAGGATVDFTAATAAEIDSETATSDGTVVTVVR